MSITRYFRSLERTTPAGWAVRSSDLVLVAIIAAIISIMILPLPRLALDALIAINITVGIVLVMMAIYINTLTDFTVFPSLLLITTLYRLSLSIATTRMILLDGHAGRIIDVFGAVAAGGNLVVGLVVFLIITVVQFVVIAKGAERVAEVAARFSLDSMPGKQMSIDSDLRSGLIDKDEARRRRRILELESKLHGSLDGAMKFVKGDAMAGIIIVLVNLIGGLAIGVIQLHLSFAAAAQTYSILTIGDGMVTQIPALLGAISAGLIVTRATDETQETHLGDAVRRQLAARPRVPLMAGVLSWVMMLVPGFPALVFFTIGSICISAGVVLDPTLRGLAAGRLRPLTRVLGHGPKPIETGATKPVQTRPVVPLLLELAGSGVQELDGAELTSRLEAVLDGFEFELGLTLPRIAIYTTEDLGLPRWRLLAFEAPIGSGDLLTDEPASLLEEGVRLALRKSLGLFVGIQETSDLLARVGLEHPELVKEVNRHLPLPRIAEVLRRLAEEETPLRDLRTILEILADVGQREKDGTVLAEFARTSLRRHISDRYAPEGELKALMLAPDLENLLRESIRTEGMASQLSLEPLLARQVIQAVKTSVSNSNVEIILTSIELRRHLRKLIEPALFNVAVLSFNELTPSLRLTVAGQIFAPRPSPVLSAA